MKKTNSKNPFLKISNFFKTQNNIKNLSEIKNIEANNVVGYQCERCLKKNGFSEICLNNFTPECQYASYDYCSECGEYCKNLCDENKGGGKEQFLKFKSFGPGGPGGGGGGAGSNCAGDDACRRVLYYPRGVPKTDPFYIMYKHTGCHLIWYPPEFAFGNNPNITQCKGFRIRSEFDGSVASCHPEWASYKDVGTTNPNLYDIPCRGYQRGSWPLWPCYCRSVPHIRDGIYGTLYNIPNINQSEGQFGYISYLDPFSDGMRYTESGCCYCSSTAGSLSDPVKTRNATPLWPDSGPSWGAYEMRRGAAGGLCTPNSRYDQPFLNENYTESCYEYGISPYLKRISETEYKIGYDIWTYGGPTRYKQDLGPLYYTTSFNRRGFWFDYDINFADSTSKTKLQNTLVGFVGLEHHFESYAYKSDNLYAPGLNAVQNNGNVLKARFERAYGGSFNTTSGCGNFTMDNDSSLKWQLYRKTPRRFMYGGAKVPLFHFDLYYFEMLSKQKNILIEGKIFDAKTFLKAYYNYFYTVISGGYVYIDPCTGAMKEGKLQYEPIHLFDPLKTDYNYVTSSLKEMIRYNIISIKDHAPDIVDEVNEVIASAKYTINQTTGQQELELNPYIDGLVGGVAGYMDLVDFFGVQPITGRVTVSKVKSLLISPRDEEPSTSCFGVENPGPQSYFRFPRRAFLPPYLKSGELVGWGCGIITDENGNQIGTSGYDSPCSSYGNPSSNIVYYPAEWIKSKFVNVFSGMHTNYWLLQTGQLAISGYTGANGSLIPPGSISYPLREEDLREQQRQGSPFGRVTKVSAKSTKLAIALVNFSTGLNFIDGESCNNSNGSDSPYGIGPGASQYHRIISWGDYGCDVSFNTGQDAIANNKQEEWVDASSGFAHVAAIGKGPLQQPEDYNNNRLFFKGNNTYGQAPGVTGAEILSYKPMAKPGYFSDFEWNKIISGLPVLTCDLNNPNNPNNDYRCRLFNNPFYGTLDRPVWSKVACGQYHSIAVQSDNQVKIWGKYFRINKDGELDLDPVTNTNCPIVDTFIPDVIKDIAAKWTLTYRNNNPNDICTSAVVEPSSAQINFIDGGPDYTMMVVGNALYVWGRVEMLPSIVPTDVRDDPEHNRLKEVGIYSTTIPGEVISISAGANCWIVNYKIQNQNSDVNSFISSFPTYKTIQWTRKHVYDIDNQNYYDYQFTPTAKQDKSSFGYMAIATGFAHVSAIQYGNLNFPKWDYSLFQLEETRKNQFVPQNGKKLPKYFESFAFFRGLPGGWDFSKWFYGKFGNEGLDTLRAPGGITTCQEEDVCSILGEPDQNDETGLRKDNWSYSGHPEYWWMQKAARRYQHGNGLYQNPGSVCDSPVTVKPFCGAAVNEQYTDAGVGMFSSCQNDYDLCWQIDGTPFHTIPTNTFPDEDGSTKCIIDCDDTDTGTKVIKKIPEYPWGPAERCTDAIGRVGFRSTKDYFLQSYKVFGLQENCCKVISTFTSSATYATRNKAFALNEDTGIWQPLTNPDPYRTEFASSTLKSATQASTTLNKNIKYPYIYIGGEKTKKVENSYYSSVFGYIENNQHVGGCDSENRCPLDPLSSGQNILGPGGWILGIIPSDAPTETYNPLALGTGGYYYFRQTIYLYNKEIKLKTPYNLIGTNNYGYESGSTFKYCYNLLSENPPETPVGLTGWAFDFCGGSYYIGPELNGIALDDRYEIKCETKKLIVFDSNDPRNYAKPEEMYLTSKWHKMNNDPIYEFPNGLTCYAGLFAGTLEQYGCDISDSVYIKSFGVDPQTNTINNLVVYTGTVFLPDACTNQCS